MSYEQRLERIALILTALETVAEQMADRHSPHHNDAHTRCLNLFECLWVEVKETVAEHGENQLTQELREFVA